MNRIREGEEGEIVTDERWEFYLEAAIRYDERKNKEAIKRQAMANFSMMKNAADQVNARSLQQAYNVNGIFGGIFGF